MEKQSRRGLLKNAAKVAAAATGGAMIAGRVSAQGASMEKRDPTMKAGTPKAAKVPLYSSANAYGNMLFLAGVGAHIPGDITVHTKFVLDKIEKTLMDSGSSFRKVLMVNVYLNDLKDYEAMNAVYASRDWGSTPPVRTTVSPAAGIPGKSLVEINCIAYI